MKNGTTYPFNDLSGYLAMTFREYADYFQVYLDSNGMQHFNETKYDEVGLAYSGAQYTWQMFMVRIPHCYTPSFTDIIAVGSLVYVVFCLVRSVSRPKDIPNVEGQKAGRILSPG